MNIYAVWDENEKVYSQNVTDLVHDLYAYFSKQIVKKGLNEEHHYSFEDVWGLARFKFLEIFCEKKKQPAILIDAYTKEAAHLDYYRHVYKQEHKEG